ncbi:hypothetical protein Glove_87g37 [Diversispora epigaea]|uniref:Uncharacterized protein n=1 Tax=Diversispora epigaea TaxID=1348612 RepID=A0A397JFU1_9GLOM|nr:hypothetical protein Glove_87g37 [Diversispora epigaea]
MAVSLLTFKTESQGTTIASTTSAIIITSNTTVTTITTTPDNPFNIPLQTTTTSNIICNPCKVDTSV